MSNATFQRTSQNLGAGYNAPECTKPSAYTLKSDVYSFGVVMLELLTGRKPLDRCCLHSQYFIFFSLWWSYLFNTPYLRKFYCLLPCLYIVQSQNQNNVLFVGPPHSFMTLMRWKKWWTLPCGDFTLQNHSFDLLISSPFVFRWVMSESNVYIHTCWFRLIVILVRDSIWFYYFKYFN